MLLKYKQLITITITRIILMSIMTVGNMMLASPRPDESPNSHWLINILFICILSIVIEIVLSIWTMRVFDNQFPMSNAGVVVCLADLPFALYILIYWASAFVKAAHTHFDAMSTANGLLDIIVVFAIRAVACAIIVYKQIFAKICLSKQRKIQANESNDLTGDGSIS